MLRDCRAISPIAPTRTTLLLPTIHSDACIRVHSIQRHRHAAKSAAVLSWSKQTPQLAESSGSILVASNGISARTPSAASDDLAAHSRCCAQEMRLRTRQQQFHEEIATRLTTRTTTTNTRGNRGDSEKPSSPGCNSQWHSQPTQRRSPCCPTNHRGPRFIEARGRTIAREAVAQSPQAIDA